MTLLISPTLGRLSGISSQHFLISDRYSKLESQFLEPTTGLKGIVLCCLTWLRISENPPSHEMVEACSMHPHLLPTCWCRQTTPAGGTPGTGPWRSCKCPPRGCRPMESAPVSETLAPRGTDLSRDTVEMRQWRAGVGSGCLTLVILLLLVSNRPLQAEGAEQLLQAKVGQLHYPAIVNDARGAGQVAVVANGGLVDVLEALQRSRE
jgi:hypothetical protein